MGGPGTTGTGAEETQAGQAVEGWAIFRTQYLRNFPLARLKNGSPGNEPLRAAADCQNCVCTAREPPISKCESVRRVRLGCTRLHAISPIPPTATRPPEGSACIKIWGDDDGNDQGRQSQASPKSRGWPAFAKRSRRLPRRPTVNRVGRVIQKQGAGEVDLEWRTRGVECLPPPTQDHITSQPGDFVSPTDDMGSR